MKEFDLFPYPKEWVSDVDVSLAGSIMQWAEKEVISKRLEYKEDYDQLLFPALKKLSLDLGLQKVLWPEAYGGEEHNKSEVAITILVALEQVGRADTGLGCLLANTLAIQSTIALYKNLNDDLCSVLAPLFNGERAVITSLILPTYGEGAAPDAFQGKNLQAIAKETDKGWIITGGKMRPTCSGATADLFGLLCAVDGSDEVAFILVPAQAKGITRGEAFKKTGLAASLNADVTFNKVKVPLSYCAWRGLERFREMLSWYYLGLSGV
jgi:alkylation response protein AidB-like acyl-CoA dehydrogenase